ncbi:MAG: hypothetical protein AAGK02_16110 [Pseudomonadota bacterium]
MFVRTASEAYPGVLYLCDRGTKDGECEMFFGKERLGQIEVELAKG